MGGLIAAFFIGVATSLLASAIWWFVQWRAKRWEIEHSPFGEVLNFNRKQKVIFIFPTRPPHPDQTRPFRHVSMEDMLAMNYVARGLALAGWDDDVVKYERAERFAQKLEATRSDGEDELDQNLVLICMSRANDVTKAALEELKKLNVLDCEFQQILGQPDRYMLLYAGVEITSDSYRQEKRLLDNGIELREGVVEDKAILIKVNNPWSRHGGKMLIVAGIRGIGTWGAGRHLRENVVEIYRAVGNSNFALVINVKYEDWNVETKRSPILERLG